MKKGKEERKKRREGERKKESNEVLLYGEILIRHV